LPVWARRRRKTFSRALCCFPSSGASGRRTAAAWRWKETIFSGSSSAGATTSASPASMALRGMLSNLAEVSAWTKATPAFSLIALRPRVPSEPMPESTTPMLRSCRSSASERKKKSIGRPLGVISGKRCRTPCKTDMSLLGGMT
jgi:hypothetical protein